MCTENDATVTAGDITTNINLGCATGGQKELERQMEFHRLLAYYNNNCVQP